MSAQFLNWSPAGSVAVQQSLESLIAKVKLKIREKLFLSAEKRVGINPKSKWNFSCFTPNPPSYLKGGCNNTSWGFCLIIWDRALEGEMKPSWFCLKDKHNWVVLSQNISYFHCHQKNKWLKLLAIYNTQVIEMKQLFTYKLQL